MKKNYTSYPKNKTLDELLERAAQNHGENLALSYYDQSITYSRFNHKVNQTAEFLLANGIKPNDIVGVLMTKSPELIISIISILKIGAICVPIDKEQPKNRTNRMLKDSNIEFLLINDAVTERDYSNVKIIRYDNEAIDKYIGAAKKLKTGRGDRPAFIIYTSGTTGKPNGVLLNHSGIMNHVYTKIKEGSLTGRDIFCYNLNPGFVASLWLIFTPIALGAHLQIVDNNDSKDPQKLFQIACEKKISVLEVTPSFLSAFLKISDNREINFSGLRLILLTGEYVKTELVNRFYSTHTVQLMNAYGQSECSDDTLHYSIPVSTETKIVPVGKPSNNTKVYILDEFLNLQPVGCSGKLYITGDCLASGYINNIPLTKQKYIDNPFQKNTVLYDTGDIAQWDENGNVVFLGREDRQVKIRGYRVELNEIENTLLKMENIQEAAVFLSEDDKIDAYIVCEKNTRVNKIRAYLENELPHYMLPTHFFMVDSFPFTPHGKLDKEKLVFKSKQYKKRKDKSASLSTIEKDILKLWNELCKGQIGIHDNLFYKGGDSLLFAIFISKINGIYNTDITIEHIIRNPTLKGISQLLEGEI